MSHEVTIHDRARTYIESNRSRHQRAYVRGLLHPQGLSDEETQRFLDAAQFLSRSSGQWASDASQLRTLFASPPSRTQWSMVSNLLGYPPELNADEKLCWPDFSTPPEPQKASK